MSDSGPTASFQTREDKHPGQEILNSSINALLSKGAQVNSPNRDKKTGKKYSLKLILSVLPCFGTWRKTSNCQTNASLL